MREYLPLADAAHSWQVINCGGISYASYRVAALMEELVRYEPDLFVVYSAHNEFLERRTYAEMFERSAASLQIQAVLSHTRTYAIADRLIHGEPAKPSNLLSAEVDEILNHTIGPSDYHRDPKWRGQVLAHYEFNLKLMVAIARRVNCKIVFVTPASNERNCSPFKSEFAEHATEVQQSDILELLARADRAAASSEFETAIATLTKATRLAPELAEAHYRLGKLLMQAQRYDEAHTEFMVALNEDVCPLRAVDEITAAIRKVGSELNVPIVDFEKTTTGVMPARTRSSVLGRGVLSGSRSSDNRSESTTRNLDHRRAATDENRRWKGFARSSNSGGARYSHRASNESNRSTSPWSSASELGQGIALVRQVCRGCAASE